MIPARGGSKRIPRKNIRPFAGKPMIGHAIAAAQASGLFDHIVVSTDDGEIASIAGSLGAEVPFMRPTQLADDHTPTVPVVAHAIEECSKLGWQAEHVCCIYPGVPLLQADDLLAGLALLEQGRSAYVFPVVPFASAIQRALRRLPDGTTCPFYPEHVGTRTQDLEPAYHDAGQFYWGHAQAWLQGLVLHTHGSTIVVPQWRAVDIDKPEDWERAEALFKAFSAQAQP